MHSDLSTSISHSQTGTTAATRATDWLPMVNRAACVVVLTAIFTYYDGIPHVSYEVASAILVGAWCVGLRSVFRRLLPASLEGAAYDTAMLAVPQQEAVVTPQDAAAVTGRDALDAPRPTGRVVAMADAARRRRGEDDERMRQAG